MPTVLFHVTRAVNRSSIQEHGVDWRRMKHWGIANSDLPEAEGNFLARDRSEAEWFVDMGSPWGELIDIWEVTLEEDFDPWDPPAHLPLVESVEGFIYCTETIPPSRLRLLR